MKNQITKHIDKIRFGLVGGANTAIDFGVLFGLAALGIDKLVANFFSTSVAFVFSFFVNKSFTFKDNSKTTRRQFLVFLVITLSGLWIIQPIVISIFTATLGLGLSSEISLLIGKLIATIFTLTWNYILYKKFVYKTT